MAHYFGAQTTPGGHRMDECISALQKSIRRGLEREAMYWAIEIECLAHQYLWNRLEVIVNEDIGIANPLAIVTAHTLKEQYLDMRARGKTSTRLVLANAIMLMCRSPKSRLADHFQMVAYRSTERFEVPDWALDKHTGRGRALGRDTEHFFTVGGQLDDAPLSDPYQEEALRLLHAGAQPKDEPYRRREGKKSGARQSSLFDGD